MNKDNAIEFNHRATQDSGITDALRELARAGTTEMLKIVLQAEVDNFIAEE